MAVTATVLSAAALLAAAHLGTSVLLTVTLALALVLTWGWPAVSGTFTPVATTVVLAVSSVLIVLSAVRTDLKWVAAAVAFGIVLAFVTQLRRTTGREGLVLSLLAAFGGLVLIASGTTAVVAGHSDRGQAAVVVAMAAVLASLVGDLLTTTRLPGPALGGIAVVVSISAAVLVGLRFDALGTAAALVVGVTVGAVSWSFRRVLAQQPGIPSVQGQVGVGVGSVLAVGALVHLAAIIT